MAVPKKRVSKTRKNLRHTNWKKELIPQARKALSFGKALRSKLTSTKNNGESVASIVTLNETAPEGSSSSG
jgi:ribosomal protein L32